MGEIFVASAADFNDGDRRIVRTTSGEVGVFAHKGSYFAYANRCVHSGGPACEGVLVHQVVNIIEPDKTYRGQTFGDDLHFVCPWHGYEFKIETGVCVGDPRLKLRRFDTVVRSGSVYIIT